MLYRLTGSFDSADVEGLSSALVMIIVYCKNKIHVLSWLSSCNYHRGLIYPPRTIVRDRACECMLNCRIVWSHEWSTVCKVDSDYAVQSLSS